MNTYQLLEEIGHGAYSRVYKARNLQSRQIVAVKRISYKNSEIGQILQREIRTLRSLQHPNIIKLYEVLSDANFTYLVFEYMPSDLITFYKSIKKSQRRNLSDTEIAYIAYQICSALSYMHECGIMHRDIKPENILVHPSSLQIKLIDFGFAKSVRLPQGMPRADHTQYMITRWYRPLEIVLGLAYDGSADVFALGALIMELYLGQEIFRSSSNIDQLAWVIDICGYPKTWPQAIIKIHKLGLTFNTEKQAQIKQMVQSLKPQAADLVISMLQVCPSDRIKMSHLLHHSYFSQFPQRQCKETILRSEQKQSIVRNENRPSMAKHDNWAESRRLSVFAGDGRTENWGNIKLISFHGHAHTQSTTTDSNKAHPNSCNNMAQMDTMDKQAKALQQSFANIVKIGNQKGNQGYKKVQINQHTQSNPQFSLDLKGFIENKPVPSLQFSTDRSQELLANSSREPGELNRDQTKRTRYSEIRNIGQSKKPIHLQGLRVSSELRIKTEGRDSSRNLKSCYMKNNDDLRVIFNKNWSDNSHFQDFNGRKKRTKSFQGINLTSLKHNDSSKALQSQMRIKNPQTNYMSTQTARRKDEVLPKEHATSRKEPIFSKIRDKLTHDQVYDVKNITKGVKGAGKLKISLTDRSQIPPFPQQFSASPSMTIAHPVGFPYNLDHSKMRGPTIV